MLFICFSYIYILICILMVYFVEFNNYVKIGFSNKNLKSRISQLQTGLPFMLNTMLVINGDRKLEKELHFKFRNTRQNGEWFLLDEYILDYINSKKDKDLSYKYGLDDSEKNELMPVRQLRRDCELTMGGLSDLMGVTTGAIQKMEQRANQGTITINKMHQIAEATGHKFEFRFKKI
ncbi:MAG: GIY-YIG nuclease family protein [Olleya sp.]